MKNNIADTTVSKLKSGTAMLLNGNTVWIEHDRQDGNVVICDRPSRNLSDEFEVVDYGDLSPVRKLGSSIQAKPKALNKYEKAAKGDLNAFYDILAEGLPFNCAECGKPLYAHNKFAQRAVCAHILPKSTFPSIATNPNNILFLGADLLGICNDHDRWDASVENRVKMKVYPIAVLKFRRFLYKELNGPELLRACNYLGINFQDYAN